MLCGTKPRIEAAITGRTPSGEQIEGDYSVLQEALANREFVCELLLQFYYSELFSLGKSHSNMREKVDVGPSKQKRETWCREGESNPQGP
jgi:hypothetical protein